MSSEAISPEWGCLIIESLVHAGVETICVSPGSRSTPLVLAADAHEELSLISILDERSAAFVALGIGKRTGNAAAVITTSGTATANLHPAVLEADRARTPLVVITADRPPRLHDSGANQTIDQRELYGRAVRASPTIPEPTNDRATQRSAAATIVTAVGQAQAPVPGPIHLNIPFAKPLSSSSAETPTAHIGEYSLPSIGKGFVTPDPASIELLQETIIAAERGAIVAGPTAALTDVRSLARLSRATGFPLFADPLSGVRFGEMAAPIPALGGYDAYLNAMIRPELPAVDVVIRAGARPTSITLQDFLTTAVDHHVLIDPAVEYRDPTFSTTAIVRADPSAAVAALEAEGIYREGGRWRAICEHLESQYWELITNNIDAIPPEGRIAHEVFAEAPADTTIFVSNSMPIRDVDRFAQPRSDRIVALGNRGVSGIDGILSTGIGAGYAMENDLVILTGDLALYHDMNALLNLERASVDATIVVINNDGGGIFHKLPIADIEPPFTDLFRTPHGLDFSHIAALYSLAYVKTTPDNFRGTYQQALGEAGSTLVEVSVDGTMNHEQRGAFETVVGEALGKNIPKQ